MDLTKSIKSLFKKENYYLALIITVLLVGILGYISYYEMKREKEYLWELASSEGLNIAFSIQTLGSEFILNRDTLNEILGLFKKEGITYIDIVDNDGIVRISTNERRINRQVNIKIPGRINYIHSEIEEENKTFRILQIIKPFDFDDRFSSDFFGYLFLRDKYLTIGINLERYYSRFNQVKQRIFLNYFIILLISMLGLFMIFRIQESRVARRTLNQMRDYTSKLLETMDSGVISVDQNKNIKTFNKKSEQIFQLTKNEVINKNAEKVLPIKVGDNSIYQSGLKEKRKIEEEVEFFTRNNNKKILEINTSLLSSEDEKENGMVLLIRDITKIKKMSKEINRNKRLASLGKLSSGIAHEIRNPLSSIRGLTQFIFQSFDESDNRKKDLKIILNEVDRLNQLINEILDYSRPKSLDISKFSMKEIIREIVQLLKLEVKDKEIEFQLNLPGTPLFIMADSNQLRQALMNILLNSNQAIKKRGEISIILSKEFIMNENFVLIKIEDNGIGIDAANLPHIFDPFFTTRSEGSGLGLSIAYNIIEMHGGYIKVDSRRWKGTVFNIYIPMRRDR